jgi:putative nucleotidyltransferase with HDIG domain
MHIPRELKSLIALSAVVAGASLVLLFVFFFDFHELADPDWLTATGILLALSLISTAMALKISQTGATSSLDFVPQLAAVLLIGPAGAAGIAAISETLSEIFFYKKPTFKKVFNTAQVVLSVAAAGFVYVLFAGESSLETFHFQQNFPRFLVAIIAYFAVNTGAVSYVVAVSEKQPFVEVWKEMTGGLIIFDFIMSLLGVGIAYFYVSTGWPVLVLTVIPLFGLRYSYGVTYELRQLNSDLLELFVRTIEAQDPYTSGHSVRVSKAAKLIARVLRCGRRELDNIEKAALLHDIGKIDVVYGEILRQKGPLTPEQRDLIRAHPDRGVEIIRSIRSLPFEVLECVRFHHERWDGKGYPVGLQGDAIPRGARIIMVCDTIDAMTTARPYRDPLPLAVVREELLKHRGTQFDPRVVDIVLNNGLLEEIYSARFETQAAGPSIDLARPGSGEQLPVSAP